MDFKKGIMKKILTFVFYIFLIANGFARNTYSDSLQVALDKATDPAHRFTVLVKIGEYGFNSGYGNIDSSVCIELFKIAQQLKGDSLMAISYNWMGAFFQFTKGDYTTSLEYYFKAIPLAENSNDKRRLSSLYFDISATYIQLLNPLESIKYSLMGRENLPDKSSPMYDFMLRQYQDNMTNAYLLLHQPDSALHYAQELNETNRRFKSQTYDLASIANFAMVYEQLGDKETAEFYYKKANALSDSINFYISKLIVKGHYAIYLLNNNKITEARILGNQLFQLGQQINNNDMKQSGAGILRRVFENNHQTDSAYYYSRLESIVKDSIFNQNNINKIQSLVFKEQLRSIEENGRRDLESQQRKLNIQYSLIALCIVTFIILFLLLSHSIVANEKWISFFGVLGLLVVFEFINLFIHPALSAVTHDSPVLMLLVLVIIASLLIPLHHRMEKWINEKMVEKNKRIRLESAKKTIQKLGDNSHI